MMAPSTQPERRQVGSAAAGDAVHGPAAASEHALRLDEVRPVDHPAVERQRAGARVGLERRDDRAGHGRSRPRSA